MFIITKAHSPAVGVSVRPRSFPPERLCLGRGVPVISFHQSTLLLLSYNVSDTGHRRTCSQVVLRKRKVKYEKREVQERTY